MEEDKGLEYLSDKEYFKKYVSNSYNRVNHDVLSLVQVLCKNDYQYSQVRAQILRINNNALRDTMAEIDSHEVKRTSARRNHVDTYNVD